MLRAFGLNFGLTETIFVLGWSLVGSLVPTPGGAAGAFHAATAAGLIFLGVERETAAAISIVMHVVDFGPAVVFGFSISSAAISISRDCARCRRRKRWNMRWKTKALRLKLMMCARRQFETLLQLNKNYSTRFRKISATEVH